MTANTRPEPKRCSKVLATFGPWGRRVRVLEYSEKKIVLVKWREGRQRRQSDYPCTPDGRRAAKAFASGLADGKVRSPEARTLTVRELWARYRAAEFPTLREKTQTGYARQWTMFSLLVGDDRPTSAITADTLDTVKKKLLESEHAPNQVRLTLATVRRVFRWARDRKAIETDVPEYRCKLSKAQTTAEPEEYTQSELELLLSKVSPTNSRTWRPWAVMMLLGHQGVRINAGLHLQWRDVREDGQLIWRKEWDKLGREWNQPIRDGTVSALLTAKQWRERDGYDGPWVFYTPRSRAHRHDRADAPYTVQGFIGALRNAEDRAGVVHRPLRASHGLRKMVAGDAWEATGDATAALQFIGDTDMRQANKYLKRRAKRLVGVAERLDSMATPSPKTTTKEQSAFRGGA